MGTDALTEFDTISGYLSWDHDRLDGILAEVCDLVERGSLAAARDRYGAFEEGLGRHIRIEEELLFPLFEARMGMRLGPTEVMREEHREIQQALVLMRDGLAVGDATGFREGLKFLRAVLPSHNDTEEHVLYPMTDRLLSDTERATFTARLQRE